MSEVKLFLGYAIDRQFADLLAETKPQFAALFINAEENSLCEVQHNGIYYLGKFPPQNCDLSMLHLLEDNIYSLLNKLIPEYPFQKVPLLIFPISIQKSVNQI